MPVFKLFEKKHIPILFILLATILIVCFGVIKKHENTILSKAITEYHHQNLLGLEKNIYIEFIERRFNIERIGSEAYIDKLKKAAEDTDSDHFITLLLKDRDFYPYLFAEGHLFMSAAALKKWKAQRTDIINPIVHQLKEYHFALSLDDYGISDLVSYLFIELSGQWLTVNILVLLICGGFLEFRLRRGKVLLLFLSSTFTCGVLYLLLANNTTPVLYGLSGFLCALIGACFTQIYLSYREGLRLKYSFILALFYISVCNVYFCALWFFERVDFKLIIIFMMMLGAGAGLYSLLYRIEQVQFAAKSQTSETGHRQDDQAFRVALAEAMSSLSLFNFVKAREQLNVMSKQYPDSPEVMTQRYHIEKLYPHERFYWECVRDLVNFAIAHNDYARMVFIFEDIQKSAPSKKSAKVSLEPEFYHKMMTVFVAHDDLNKAEKAFLFLELAGNLDIIKDACRLLIHEFKTRGMRGKYQQYQMLFERTLP